MTIKEDLSKFIRKIKEIMPIKCIILFGSRARGDFTRFSDIDLIIMHIKRKFLCTLREYIICSSN
ncbi:MAG: nucleotidyltransferase domain-containing protein [Candidatus Helarchaeota archaeon]